MEENSEIERNAFFSRIWCPLQRPGETEQNYQLQLKKKKPEN